MSKKILIMITLVSLARLLLGLNLWARPKPEEVEVVEEAPGVVTKYKEAPMLAALAARGELPSVDERLLVGNSHRSLRNHVWLRPKAAMGYL